MKRLALLTTIVAAVVLLPAGLVLADNWCGGGVVWSNTYKNAPADLRLSPEQMTSVERIHRDYAPRFTALNRRLASISGTIDRELAKPEPDSAQVTDLRKHMALLVVGVRTLSDRMNSEIDQVLTEAQRQYFTSAASEAKPATRGSANYAFAARGMNGPYAEMRQWRRFHSARGTGSCWDWS